MPSFSLPDWTTRVSPERGEKAPQAADHGLSVSCFCATEALIASVKDTSSLQKSSSIRAIALFDNEEVGSVSTHGAESNMLASTVRRLATVPVKGISTTSEELSDATSYERAIARSFLISSDMAHGVYAAGDPQLGLEYRLTFHRRLAFHPNYASFYEDNHRPVSFRRDSCFVNVAHSVFFQRLNGGPVVKTNAKQRYASTAPTTFLLRRLAKIADVPLQEFEVRNDMPCGSTIGPMMSKVRKSVANASRQ